MTYLLDTHTFLWFIGADEALSAVAQRTIENPDSVIYISVASLWEIAIKISLGKLVLPTPLNYFLMEQITRNNIVILPIETAHVGLVATLPFHHRDPFDRLIIVQSLIENLTIIGKDQAFDAYNIKRLW